MSKTDHHCSASGKGRRCLRTEMVKRPRVRDEWERPADLFGVGSYFTRVESRGRGGRAGETRGMPCKATIVRREGRWLTVIVGEPERIGEGKHG